MKVLLFILFMTFAVTYKWYEEVEGKDDEDYDAI